MPELLKTNGQVAFETYELLNPQGYTYWDNLLPETRQIWESIALAVLIHESK